MRNESRQRLAERFQVKLSFVRGTANNKEVSLEAAKFGGRWITTPGAIQRFVAAQNTHVATEEAPAAPRSPTQRRRSGERAARKLDKMGI
jgi:hypothetical protein